MSKGKKTWKKQSKSLGDVTLNDFANAAICKNRERKSNSNVTHVLKKLEEDKSWEEKTEEEFEGEFVENEAADGTVSYVIKKTETRRRKKSTSETSKKGVDYPLDIWFLISDYVRPEDVGKFACICKSSFAVVQTAKFWFGLYKRYYKSVPGLPESLQPERLLRLYGVRSNVIRALHFMYTPFVHWGSNLNTLEQHPDCLKKRQCVLMWHRRQNKQWCYFFKMRESTPPSLPYGHDSEKPDLIEMLEDVSANPEENCKILEVTCKRFINIPIVQGLRLTSVSQTLSEGFRYHRLQLGFGSGISYGSQKIGGSNCTTILLDPVINVKVLDWWHPLYPHNSNLQMLLNDD